MILLTIWLKDGREVSGRYTWDNALRLIKFASVQKMFAGFSLGAMLLMGCATTEYKAANYPNALNLSLICADEESVDRTCREGGAIGDDGRVVPEGVSRTVIVGHSKGTVFESIYLGACWKPQARELWMVAGRNCSLLAHEFCHIDGKLSRSECEKNYPVEAK